ncbi:NIPSNAP family protein [Luteimonas sp. RD2P54]|uniref:NIPSNAP family protein n=1 Tax=Luteimonas endophytica TaxID=3042023 RepID=A0ABT6J7R0_9GAMM|nr:NIPSNAP family protein [Luteimonas endophytica]MDH5822635.1 NIPSNAP family protein [Luteimonas endophytica]
MSLPGSLPAVVELRRYLLHPGRRDTLIGLFEGSLAAPQEACGMRLLGRFADLDAPERFVWLRGFADMQARRRALQAFYGGPVWRRHRDAANATMIDSDDVLLLRPVLAPDPAAGARPADGAAAGVLGVICHFDAPFDAALPERFRAQAWPYWRNRGAVLLGGFASEHARNTFPALPVREGEHVFAWFARVPAWPEGAAAAVWHADAGGPAPRGCETMRLRPTAASPW